MDKLVSQLDNLLKGFYQQLEEYLPIIEMEIDQIIATKNTSSKKIESYLDTLLSLCQHGIGNALFIKLLEYYKTIDVVGAKFYWEEYDNLEE